MSTRERIIKTANGQGWTVPSDVWSATDTDYMSDVWSATDTDFMKGGVRVSVAYTANGAIYCAYLMDRTHPKADMDGIVSELGGDDRNKAAKVIDWLETQGVEFEDGAA